MSIAQRLSLKNFGAEFLDAIQGLATLKAFGQSTAYGRMLADKARQLSAATMRVLATSLITRGVIDVGIGVGAAAAHRARRLSFDARPDDAAGAAHRADVGHRDFSPVARFPHRLA